MPRQLDEIRNLIHARGENDCVEFPTPLVITLQSTVNMHTLELKKVWINESRHLMMQTVWGNSFEVEEITHFKHDVIDGLLVELRKPQLKTI